MTVVFSDHFGGNEVDERAMLHFPVTGFPLDVNPDCCSLIRAYPVDNTRKPM